ncbi:biotin transporter BioY [Corynebacterium liangguodongii]|uniref:Biotin transporter n=1 Tax=Corynebacterium liangguodongii TaxID=2079535 RepID=A0A2S0WEK0_9CORY|nr:biotin transporter BioY [Corynebacterium liangguodongii]AWB84198.1 biotin transporter BioY [Corynebacterium liangguodongii]PWC00208.1 ECF transporter S component [Corynebacterium liangguodongii]
MSTSISSSQHSGSPATTDIAYVAVFTALVIVLGFVSVPVGALGVPIVLQNTALILAAMVLGPRRGFFVAALFLLVGFVFPVLAGGRTTYFSLSSPTVGYVLSYLIAVPVAGFIAARGADKRRSAQVALFTLAGILGLALQYLCGAAGMVLRAGLDVPAALAAQLPFIPTDVLEMAVMVAVALGVHSAFPGLLRGERS